MAKYPKYNTDDSPLRDHMRTHLTRQEPHTLDQYPDKMNFTVPANSIYAKLHKGMPQYQAATMKARNFSMSDSVAESYQDPIEEVPKPPNWAIQPQQEPDPLADWGNLNNIGAIPHGRETITGITFWDATPSIRGILKQRIRRFTRFTGNYLFDLLKVGG